MRTKILCIFIFSVSLLSGQNTDLYNSDHESILIMNGKYSYYKESNNSNRKLHRIDLTRHDLKQLDSIEIKCDTLTITSYTFSSGDCGLDFIITSNTNKLSDRVKLFISKDRCNKIWFDEIEATSDNGRIFEISPLKINIIK